MSGVPGISDRFDPSASRPARLPVGHVDTLPVDSGAFPRFGEDPPEESLPKGSLLTRVATVKLDGEKGYPQPRTLLRVLNDEVTSDPNIGNNLYNFFFNRISETALYNLLHYYLDIRHDQSFQLAEYKNRGIQQILKKDDPFNENRTDVNSIHTVADDLIRQQIINRSIRPDPEQKGAIIEPEMQPAVLAAIANGVVLENINDSGMSKKQRQSRETLDLFITTYLQQEPDLVPVYQGIAKRGEYYTNKLRAVDSKAIPAMMLAQLVHFKTYMENRLYDGKEYLVQALSHYLKATDTLQTMAKNLVLTQNRYMPKNLAPETQTRIVYTLNKTFADVTLGQKFDDADQQNWSEMSLSEQGKSNLERLFLEPPTSINPLRPYDTIREKVVGLKQFETQQAIRDTEQLYQVRTWLKSNKDILNRAIFKYIHKVRLYGTIGGEWPLVLGALFNPETPEDEIEFYRRYGRVKGAIAQLLNDLNDFMPLSENDMRRGKSKGDQFADLRECKLTLPVIMLLSGLNFLDNRDDGWKELVEAWQTLKHYKQYELAVKGGNPVMFPEPYRQKTQEQLEGKHGVFSSATGTIWDLLRKTQALAPSKELILALSKKLETMTEDFFYPQIQQATDVDTRKKLIFKTLMLKKLAHIDENNRIIRQYTEHKLLKDAINTDWARAYIEKHLDAFWDILTRTPNLDEQRLKPPGKESFRPQTARRT